MAVDKQKTRVEEELAKKKAVQIRTAKEAEILVLPIERMKTDLEKKSREISEHVILEYANLGKKAKEGKVQYKLELSQRIQPKDYATHLLPENFQKVRKEVEKEFGASAINEVAKKYLKMNI